MMSTILSSFQAAISSPTTVAVGLILLAITMFAGAMFIARRFTAEPKPPVRRTPRDELDPHPFVDAVATPPVDEQPWLIATCDPCRHTRGFAPGKYESRCGICGGKWTLVKRVDDDMPGAA